MATTKTAQDTARAVNAILDHVDAATEAESRRIALRDLRRISAVRGLATQAIRRRAWPVLLLTHPPVVEGARFIESLRKPISWAFLAKFCFLPAENNGIANKVQGMMYTAVKVRLDSRSRRQSCLTVPHGRKT